MLFQKEQEDVSAASPFCRHRHNLLLSAIFQTDRTLQLHSRSPSPYHYAITLF